MDKGLTPQEVAELYRQYGHLLLRRCRVLLRDEALADDALQEAFIKIMRYGRELREVTAKLRWLYRVADRCCFDLIRKRKAKQTVLVSSSKLDAALAGPASGTSAELRAAAIGLLARLGDRERRIAVLAFVDEMSQGEIAEEVGLSRQSVNKKLQAVRKKAERLLNKDRRATEGRS